MMQGLKSTIKEGLGAHNDVVTLHMRVRSTEKKDSLDSSLAGSGTHDNGDKATRGREGSGRKGHPSF